MKVEAFPVLKERYLNANWASMTKNALEKRQDQIDRLEKYYYTQKTESSSKITGKIEKGQTVSFGKSIDLN